MTGLEKRSLYPTFDPPTVTITDESTEQALLPAPLFDFDAGDFFRDGANRVLYVDGRDSYILWTLKTLKTQLGACRAYPECGIDIEDAVRQPTREAVQSALERTITEALLMHSATERVYNFQYDWGADCLSLSMIVKPKEWPAFDVNWQLLA